MCFFVYIFYEDLVIGLRFIKREVRLCNFVICLRVERLES